MLRSVFSKSMRDQLRPLLWWALGVAVFVAYVLVAYPTVRDNPAISELLDSYPEELRNVLLAGTSDITSPEGYLTSYLFALFAPLLLLVYAVGQGAGTIAGEEERGTLDLLLANPISRSRVLIEKFLALVVGTAFLGLVLWLVLWAGSGGVQLDLGADRLAAASVGAVVLALFFGALALALGAGTGNRGLSMAIGGAAAIGAYFVNTLGAQVDVLKDLREWLPFYLYSGNQPLRNGFDLGSMAILIAATLALAALALALFRRRDLAV